MIAAAKRYGTLGFGVALDADLVSAVRCRAARLGWNARRLARGKMDIHATAGLPATAH
jgi:hypothetical protein